MKPRVAAPSPRLPRHRQPEGEERSVAILFLAHEGVANPELWEAWANKDEAYRRRIKFFVFRNKSIRYKSRFAVEHDTGLRRYTSWGNSSIVRATLDALNHILQVDETIAIIYIVSGNDIPVQHPEAIFTTRELVTEGVNKRVEPFQTVLASSPDGASLKDMDGWKDDEKDVRDKVRCHVQWCALTAYHARLIVEYPGLDRLLTIGSRLSHQWCPDEWIIGTVLNLLNVAKRNIQDWPMTDQYRVKHKDQSPIMWTNVVSTKQRVLWAPPNYRRTFTLASVIDQVSRPEGNLFLRKVERLSDADSALLIDLLFHGKQLAEITRILSRKPPGVASEPLDRGEMDIASPSSSPVPEDDDDDGREEQPPPSTPLTRSRSEDVTSASVTKVFSPRRSGRLNSGTTVGQTI